MQKIVCVCDRCGAPYENSGKRKRYEVYKENEMFCMCLCDRCQMELDDWADNKEIKSNNPAKGIRSPHLPVKNIFD